MAKDGHIYKRGNIYWIKYYRGGKPYYESAKSEKESEAKRLLRKRLGQIAEGRFFGLRPERVKFEGLAKDFVNDYRVNGKRSLDKAQRSVRHLQGFFGGMRAVDITTDSACDDIRVLHRLAQGGSPRLEVGSCRSSGASGAPGPRDHEE
jgi:hypothetical protein